jgi:arsenite-transporting ATPase
LLDNISNVFHNFSPPGLYNQDRFISTIGILTQPTSFLFFTGKGGVGKTAISTAIALSLVDSGKKVLLVSIDAASNLNEMLGVELRNNPVPVPNVKGLWFLILILISS